MSEYTSISRLTHIPCVESGIATVHSTLSSTPLVRTPYAISLYVSSKLAPLVHSVCAHYPLAPLIHVGDKAANKTLDIAQGTWPYPFQTDPEQMWKDVQSAAKGVDHRFAPIVDTLSTMVTKISGNNVEAGKTDENTFQFQRVYALLQAIKDDLMRSTGEQATIIRKIHVILTRATEQSGTIIEAILSRSEDAVSKTQELGRSVLAELEKLPPLLTDLSSSTSTNLRDTINTLHATLYAAEPWTQKLPKVRNTLQHGIKDVIEDVSTKVHHAIDDFRSTGSSSPSAELSFNTNGKPADETDKHPPAEPSSKGDRKPAEGRTGESEKKLKSKNTRIVTNVSAGGGTALNTSEDTNLAGERYVSAVKEYSALSPKESSGAKESASKKKRRQEKPPFQNENIAVAGSTLSERRQ